MGNIQDIIFSGYKSFANDNTYEISLLPYVSVFIGKNNCGKSSCIDVIENAIKPGEYMKTKREFSNIKLGFKMEESDISRSFLKNNYGGDILGNHYKYAKNFIGKILYTSLDVETSLNNRHIVTKMCTAQPELELPTGRVEWEKVAHSYSEYQSKYQFRRINADRDIVPEKEHQDENLDWGGFGATNLLRKFINHNEYDEKMVEETLLEELNDIMFPDSKFKSIKVQEIEKDDEILWEIYLEEMNGKRFALSKSGSGLKTIILMLINLYIIPYTKEYKGKLIIFAFEELENNLHPALQRKVFEYLYKYAKNNNTYIFITTHSHIAINTFFDKENTAIYHVSKNDESSNIMKVQNHADKINILNDLDVKASDLFQSNGIIWVEGPSDRIYINKWLKVFCDSKFLEGSDYQFLYYGGRVLSHYSADNEQKYNDLINILTTNRNCAIVIDSDKRNKNQRINETKGRIKKEFENINCVCWITKGKEIENYLPNQCIEEEYEIKIRKIEQYEEFPKYIEKHDKYFSNHKVDFANKVSEHITYENSKDMLDLEMQIKKLYCAIGRWNNR